VCYAVAKPKLDWGVARAFIPLSMVNVLNVISGLMGTAGLNVPMFIALRRFTLLCTIILERVLLHRSHDRSTWGAVGIMIGGALVAASTDLSFNLYGYVSVGLNDFLTALYLVMVKRSPATQGLTTTGILFYNAVLSMPALAVALTISREPWHLLQFPDLHSRGFRATLMLSCALGLTINHSTFVCTRYNDPLTTSVAGNLKNVLMTAVGVFAFGDFLYHRWNTMGICISMGGAIWYATRAALRARKKSFQQQMLLSRSSSKQPIIGRDRLAILRANGTLPHVNSGIPSTIGQNKRTAAATPATHVTVEVLPEEGQNREPGPD